MDEINSIATGRALLELSDSELLRKANKLRLQHFGSKIDLCGIINCRSGNCSMDCAFCAQSSHYGSPQTFPLLSQEALLKQIYALAKLPVSHIGLVASGSALGEQEITAITACLAKLPHHIKTRICTSFGRLPANSLKSLKAAGIKRYHHNLETSASFYPQICRTQTHGQREKTVLRARMHGFSNCTGGLFGLGETWLDRIEFALELKALGIKHIPLNFLHPQPNTPLGTRPTLKCQEALRIIALFRLILPEATLRVCGGRPLTFGTNQGAIFLAGANALMIGDYLTTAGQRPQQDLALLTSLGLKPAYHD
ncbi:MAG: biotin synthase BioB [Desulfovibrionaceae bacterium]|nr:biotin synthase BioB [Desulfovibrionaceae bacterium]